MFKLCSGFYFLGFEAAKIPSSNPDNAPINEDGHKIDGPHIISGGQSQEIVQDQEDSQERDPTISVFYVFRFCFVDDLAFWL